MFCGSWSPLADRAIDLKPRFLSKNKWVNFLLKAEGFRGAFYSPIFDPLKRQMFSKPLRWHANPINSRWRPIERRSQRILRFSLGVGFMALIPVIELYKLFSGILTDWVAYQERGIRREAAGRYFAAADDFARAIQLAPPNPALHFFRGNALLRAGVPQEAAVEFEAGLKLDPNNVTLRSLLDQALQTRTRAAAGSARVLSRWVRPFFQRPRLPRPRWLWPYIPFIKRVLGYPQNWMAYQERGIRRAAAGAYFGAAEDFARAIQLGPPNSELHILRGNAFLCLSEAPLAAMEFEAGLRLNPANEPLRSLLDLALETSRAPPIAPSRSRRFWARLSGEGPKKQNKIAIE